jgi:hypothetical protein
VRQIVRTAIGPTCYARNAESMLLLKHLFEQFVLAFEMRIKRALRYTGCRRDFVHSGPLEAMTVKDCVGGIDNLLPRN